MRHSPLLGTVAVLAFCVADAGLCRGAPGPANVSLDLTCKKGAFALGEPVTCTLTLMNHLAQSHLVYVPADLFPIKVPQWPLALLQFEVLRLEDATHLQNAYLEEKCILPGRFSGRDLLKLDIGRAIGWELDLANGYNWQFHFVPGTYRVKAVATIGILGSAATSDGIRGEVRRAMCSRFKDADFLVLDGTLESPSIEFRIVQPGER